MQKNPFDIENLLEDLPEIEDMTDEEFEAFRQQMTIAARKYELFDIKQQAVLDACHRQQLEYEELIKKAEQILHVILVHIREAGPNAEMLRLAELATDEPLKVAFHELANIAQRQKCIFTSQHE